MQQVVENIPMNPSINKNDNQDSATKTISQNHFFPETKNK
jgi:hypothetical protein